MTNGGAGETPVGAPHGDDEAGLEKLPRLLPKRDRPQILRILKPHIAREIDRLLTQPRPVI